MRIRFSRMLCTASLAAVAALAGGSAFAQDASKPTVTFSKPIDIRSADTTQDVLMQSDNYKDGVLTVGDFEYEFDENGHAVLKDQNGWTCNWFGWWCASVDEDAIIVTREDGKKRVIDRVVSEIHAEMVKDTGRVLPMIGYAWPEALPAGTVIRHFFGNSSPLNVTQDSWFFFLDLEPGAEYGHRVQYVLVDVRTGEILSMRAYSPPVLDGKPWLMGADENEKGAAWFYPEGKWVLPPPGIWPMTFNAAFPKIPVPKDENAYVPPSSNIVYENSLADLFVQTAQAQNPPPGVQPCPEPRRKVAIVVNGEPRARSMHFEQSAGAAMAMFKNLGVTNRDMHYINADRIPKPEDAIKEIEKILKTLGPCDKLFFYITGHGTIYDENDDHIPDSPSDSIVYGDGELGKGRYGDSFMEALTHAKAGIVNITIQSCFAGSVPTMIDNYGIRPPDGTTWHIFPSSDSQTSSYGNEDEYRASHYTENLTYCVAVKLGERGITNPTIEQIEEITRECHNQLVANPEELMKPDPITDVQPETIKVSPDISVKEGDDGVTYAEFTITRNPATRPLKVRHSTYDPDIENDDISNYPGPKDYEWNKGGKEIDFAPGETTKTVRIAINGDKIVEKDERFGVFFGSLGITRHVTILDDDTPVAIASSSSAPSVAVTGEYTVVVTEPVEVDPTGGLDAFGKWLIDEIEKDKEEDTTGGSTTGGVSIKIDVGGWTLGGGYSYGYEPKTEYTLTVTCPKCDELKQQYEAKVDQCDQLESDLKDAQESLADLDRQISDAQKNLKNAENALNEFNNPKSYAESNGRRITSSDLKAERAWGKDVWNQYKDGDLNAKELEQKWKDGMSDADRQKYKDQIKADLEQKVANAKEALDGLSDDRAQTQKDVEKLTADVDACHKALFDLRHQIEECEKACTEPKTITDGQNSSGASQSSADDDKKESSSSSEKAKASSSTAVSSSKNADAQHSSSAKTGVASSKSASAAASSKSKSSSSSSVASSAKSVSCTAPAMDLKTCEKSCEDPEKGECVGVTGEGCYVCKETSTAPTCPSGTTPNRYECEEYCGHQGGSCVQDTKGCYSCTVAQCPAGTTKNQCPSSCANGCDVVGQDGGTTCYQCKKSCTETCAQNGYTQVGTNWNNYMQGYLNGYSCVSGASVELESVTIGSCTCSNQPVIEVNMTPSVCKGTPCGDVQCGTSSSCTQGTTQLTVSCKWGGWKNIGENQFQPIIGQ